MTSARNTTAAVGVLLGAVVAAGLVATAASAGGVSVLGIPVVGLCAALAFLFQWVAFVPAYLRQTERFYDLVGSITYLSVTAFALVAAGHYDSRSFLLAGLICVWALRLGTFLFRRIRSEGSDARFDHIKASPARFVTAWTLQGLWVFLTLCAALAAMTTAAPTPLGVLDVVGLAVWGFGFTVEAVADRQKSRFRKAKPGRYIDTGLWAWSRHPNYFGEIVLWAGIAVIAASTLRGWQWVTLISPVFVLLLLTRVSGIPILENRADARWGDEKGYQAYKARTPILFLRPPTSKP